MLPPVQMVDKVLQWHGCLSGAKCRWIVYTPVDSISI